MAVKLKTVPDLLAIIGVVHEHHVVDARGVRYLPGGDLPQLRVTGCQFLHFEASIRQRARAPASWKEIGISWKVWQVKELAGTSMLMMLTGDADLVGHDLDAFLREVRVHLGIVHRGEFPHL